MKNDIRKAFDQWTANWNRGDKHGYLDAYLQSPRTRYVGGKTIVRGHDAIMEYLFPKCAQGQLSLTAFEVDCLTTTDALVFGRFCLELPPLDAESEVLRMSSGCFTVHMTYVEGMGWKIASDHSS